jgi:hypothetical protein
MRNWIMSLMFVFTVVSFGQLSEEENIAHYPGYEILAGAGYLELFYGGLRINAAEGIWFGLRAGSVPDEMLENTQALSFDVYFYHSKYKTLYIKPGVTLNFSESDDEKSTNGWFNLQAGKSFRISERTGIRLDAGINYLVFEKVDEKKDAKEPFLDDLDINFFPGINLEFYFLL